MKIEDFGEDLSTDEKCDGCDGDISLVMTDEHVGVAQCPCSVVSVLVGA